MQFEDLDNLRVEYRSLNMHEAPDADLSLEAIDPDPEVYGLDPDQSRGLSSGPPWQRVPS